MALDLKARLHRLVDLLPVQDEPMAERLLRDLVTQSPDPVLRMFLQAMEDDESFSSEEASRSESAWHDYQEGHFQSLDQVVREELRERDD